MAGATRSCAAVEAGLSKVFLALEPTLGERVEKGVRDGQA